VRPDEELVRRVEALVTALGWNGIFEVELIRRADGSYAVIDFNPRVYGSLALSEAAGVPLATIWCDTLLGRPREGFTAAAPGIAYRCEDFDARHLLLNLSRRHPRAALDVLRPHRHVAHAYADLHDPIPVVVRWASGILRRVRWR
jgi:predicted ATP-grasp superfamily ATP-dependent carboligase